WAPRSLLLSLVTRRVRRLRLGRSVQTRCKAFHSTSTWLLHRSLRTRHSARARRSLGADCLRDLLLERNRFVHTVVAQPEGRL
ncbi:MAG: hypothetical protein V3U08_08905, partial [Nitrospirales bacterium]